LRSNDSVHGEPAGALKRPDGDVSL
jgi:hypothetical protein